MTFQSGLSGMESCSSHSDEYYLKNWSKCVKSVKRGVNVFNEAQLRQKDKVKKIRDQQLIIIK